MFIFIQMLSTHEERLKFEELYFRYRELLYKIAYNILGNETDAEDAVQQAFLSIIENFDKISKNSKIDCPKTKAFCVIVLERKALDILRERTRHPETELSDDAAGIGIREDLKMDLENAVASLPAKYRQYILLRYDMGFNVKEISEILGEKPDTVRKALYRARQRLKEMLEGYEL